MGDSEMTNAERYHFADFTRENYRRLLRLARQTYAFRTYANFGQDECFVLWRHDVDYSVHAAQKMARIEAEEGVVTTYLLHLHNVYYNLLEREVTDCVRDILALGHEIGLHFDTDYHQIADDEQLATWLQREARVLEEFYPIHVKAYNDLFDCLINGDISFIAQDESSASYTCHRGPDDGEIDWTRSTREIFNFVRAQSHPYPGAFSFYRNQKFHIWRVSVPENPKRFVGRIPGKVVERHPSGYVEVLTGDGVLRIEEISVNGETILPSKFLNSVRQTLGYKPRQAIEELENRIKAIERLLQK